ncbi:MAG: Fe-Mn family superoxide dismutase [Patescibacteria group bacterium]|nr:Fe-Mn family superoxide dismutase [Patescibacteria group bacterium]
MKTFETKTFDIPELKGISKKSIEEHLKLYSGYVKNANNVLAKIAELSKDAENNAYVIGELHRRFAFEYNGMRNHESYFASFQGGAKAIDEKSALMEAIKKEYGSFDAWLSSFKGLAMTRGIGWAMLYYDRNDSRLIMSWVDEQHLGQLNACDIILGLDMWEHSYVADYQPSGKKQYVEDFFANLNWEIVEKRFH